MVFTAFLRVRRIFFRMCLEKCAAVSGMYWRYYFKFYLLISCGASGWLVVPIYHHNTTFILIHHLPPFPNLLREISSSLAISSVPFAQNMESICIKSAVSSVFVRLSLLGWFQWNYPGRTWCGQALCHVLSLGLYSISLPLVLTSLKYYECKTFHWVN